MKNENRTSQAVEDILVRCDGKQASDMIPVEALFLTLWAEKYKRMEETLRFCSQYADQILSHDEDNAPAMSIENTCRDALSFDPLSSIS